MTNYVVTTRSTFENKYLIDAITEDDAIFAVMNDYDPPDFFQKHLGEAVISVEKVPEQYDMFTEMHKQGYF